MIRSPTTPVGVLFTLALLTTALGCDGPAPDHDLRPTVDTLASGTLVVANRTAAAWRDVEPWTAEEVLRIGALDGTGPEVFGRVGVIHVDGDGNLLVMDDMAGELRTFSPDGRFVGAVGRVGEGPQEFGGVVGMAVAPDGTLWVVDSRNQRYALVEDGSIRQTIPRPVRTGTRPWEGGFAPDERLYERRVEIADEGRRDWMDAVSAEGEVVESVRIPLFEPQALSLGGIALALPFAASVIRSWDPTGGVWQARSSDYELTRVDLDGRVTHIVTLDRDSRPLSPEEADSIDAVVARLPPAFRGEVSEEAIPTTAPQLRWLTVDERGGVWVCATGTDPCSVVDVFRASGEYAGSVEFPDPLMDLPLPLVRSGVVYAGVEGPMGEPQVAAFRIRGWE